MYVMGWLWCDHDYFCYFCAVFPGFFVLIELEENGLRGQHEASSTKCFDGCFLAAEVNDEVVPAQFEELGYFSPVPSAQETQNGKIFACIVRSVKHCRWLRCSQARMISVTISSDDSGRQPMQQMDGPLAARRQQRGKPTYYITHFISVGHQSW